MTPAKSRPDKDVCLERLASTFASIPADHPDAEFAREVQDKVQKMLDQNCCYAKTRIGKRLKRMSMKEALSRDDLSAIRADFFASKIFSVQNSPISSIIAHATATDNMDLIEDLTGTPAAENPIKFTLTEVAAIEVEQKPAKRPRNDTTSTSILDKERTEIEVMARLGNDARFRAVRAAHRTISVAAVRGSYGSLKQACAARDVLEAYLDDIRELMNETSALKHVVDARVRHLGKPKEPSLTSAV
ncbi:hypothetical protein CMQ_436 [Grosmannia clavigera kw1407]|uniref:Uncharacterized protein n=1 Tax=Grosmannia clavigera (strain kw1407 / UAMH 11150) TaxID=655863 RepID=F0XE41_GROCL|nr:uncharacterized protein CMQ_436 [Grosmannia clavigera kw1407]EFX03508.1 hypothetical protein CMQ_436 [Grosmannia clavigera kw1407]